MAFVKDTNRSRGVGAIAAVDGVTQRRILQRRAQNRAMAIRDRRLAAEVTRAFGSVDQRMTEGGGGPAGGGGGSTGGGLHPPPGIMGARATGVVANRLPPRTTSPLGPYRPPTKGTAGGTVVGPADPVLTADPGGDGGGGTSAPPADVATVDPNSLFPDEPVVDEPTEVTPTASTGPNWLLWGGVALGAYLLYHGNKGD